MPLDVNRNGLIDFSELWITRRTQFFIAESMFMKKQLKDNGLNSTCITDMSSPVDINQSNCLETNSVFKDVDRFKKLWKSAIDQKHFHG